MSVDVDESSYRHKYIWKRRIRNAPSAPKSDMEIHLYVLWNPVGKKDRATTADVKDPLLWAVWQFGSGTLFKVMVKAQGGGLSSYYADKKTALAEYKKRVKEFPRSKEIDYGFPVDDGT